MMEDEFEYYPADNGAIIHVPEVGSVDVVQRADGNESRKLAGSNYIGRMIVDDIEQCYEEALKSCGGVIIGVKVKVECTAIMKKYESK